MPSRFLLVVVAATMLGIAVPSAVAQNKPTRVTGEIVAVEGEVLRIKTASGQVTPITLVDATRVTKRVPIRLDQIKPGLFLGTTARPSDDGTLVASEVHVFPEASRGTNEGHRPMGDDQRSTMTNATVKEVKSTTNATVAVLQKGKSELRMTLAYKDGEKTIVVPASTPVVLSEPGGRADLKRGEHVIVTAATGADGSLQAERISVGVRGSVPPV